MSKNISIADDVNRRTCFYDALAIQKQRQSSRKGGGVFAALNGFLVRRMASRYCLGVYEGIPICDFASDDETQQERFWNCLTDAIALIQAHDLRRFRRLQRYVTYVMNTKCLGGGLFSEIDQSCAVDFARHDFTDVEWGTLLLARTLVHESTHGVIYTRGVRRRRSYSLQAEQLCHREEIRFARRVWPDMEIEWDEFDAQWHTEYRALSWHERIRCYICRVRQADPPV